MTLDQIVAVLDGDFLTQQNHHQIDVQTGCGCDLMSDVLAFIKQDALLLTGLTNTQVIRTAEMADVKAICFVRGKKPDHEVIALAEEKEIALMATTLPLFEACSRLSRNGLAGCSEYES